MECHHRGATFARYSCNVTTQILFHAGLLDPEGLLKGFGSAAFGIALVILVIECGVIFGAILPGDSLLFIVGVLIASGFISVSLIPAIFAMSAAAFVGNLIGYWTGARLGPALFKRADSKIFKQEFVTTTHDFFDKYGTRAIVLARFIPVVRSVITSMAGIGQMNYRTFAMFSAIGAVVWVTVLTVAGYLLGNVIFVKQHIDLVTVALIALSAIPLGLAYLRSRRTKK